MLFWNTMLFNPFDQTFSQRWRKLWLSKERSGTGRVLTKLWCSLGEKGWEVVSLSRMKGWLSAGNKQIRFDSPRPSLLKPLSPVPRTNKGTFLEENKMRSALFFGQFFTSCCFVAFVLSLFLVSILLVFWWPGQVSVQNCSRKSRGFSGILGKFLRVNLH